MTRERTKPGTWGKVSRKRLTPEGAKPEKWEASTYYRELSGRRSQVTATASTGPKAESKLLGKLSNRYKPPAPVVRSPTTPQSKNSPGSG